MEPTWAGAARLRRGRLVYGGAIGPTVAHAHHSVQVIAALAGELVLSGPDGESFACRAAIIPADVAHGILRGVPAGVMLHLDPRTPAAQRIAELGGGPEEWCEAGERWVGDLRDRDPFAAAEAVDSLLVGDDSIPETHPRLAKVLAELPALIEDRTVGLADAAKLAGLSESRLAHLFQDRVGLPFRSYVLWLRLGRATELVAAGVSITDAAHGAGFADGAHLSRVCRRMFGIAPTDFTRQIRWPTV
jgi:AraC-like DNA-binding protein